MIGDVTVRLAGADDLETLVELRRSSAPDEGRTAGAAFSEEFAEWYRTERGHRLFWLAAVRGQAVGMANLLVFTRMPTPGKPAGRWGYLGNMYVRREHRNHGVGSRLLAAMVDHADAIGLERVVLNPTEQSVPLYRRAGFGSADQLLLRRLPASNA